MNVFQYAVITTANRMYPNEKGWGAAQDWKRDVVQRLQETEPQSEPDPQFTKPPVRPHHHF